MTTAQDLTLEKHHGEKYVLEMLLFNYKQLTEHSGFAL